MRLDPLHVRWQRTDLDRPLAEPVGGGHGDVWVGSSQLGAGGRTLAHPELKGSVYGAAVTEDRVFVSLYPNGLQALDATGEPLWRRDLGERRNGVGKPAIGPDGNLYVGALSWFGSYTPAGELRFEKPVGHSSEEVRVTQAPLFLKDSVVYQDSHHRLQALTLDGQPLWTAKLGPITEGPLALNRRGHVLVGCTDGLMAIQPGRKEPAWKSEFGVCMGTGAAVTREGHAVISGWDDHLTCLDDAGQKVWRTPLEATPITTPTLTSDGKIVVNLDDGRMAVLSSSGEVLGYQGQGRKDSVRWSEAVRPVEIDGVLLCAGRYGTLTALELDKPPFQTAGQAATLRENEQAIQIGSTRLKRR